MNRYGIIDQDTAVDAGLAKELFPWRYRRLRDGEIRLLQLQTNHDTETQSKFYDGPLSHLSFSFVTTNLSNPDFIDFEALSYVWGDVHDTVPIIISDEFRTGFLTISRNLLTALECIAACPASIRPRYLWVDALCINQADLAERAKQVDYMRQIYSCAYSVLVFLTPNSQPLELGLRYLECLAEDPSVHYDPSLEPHVTVSCPEDDSKLLHAGFDLVRNSILAFFNAPWWTRVWTVQEYALARRVVFQCGLRRTEGQIITKAFSAIRKHQLSCCWTARVRQDHSKDSLSLIDIPSSENGGLTLFLALIRVGHLQVILGHLHFYQEPERLGIKGLLDTLGLFRMRKCNDPRDHIFGMLGLPVTDQDLNHRIKPDYSVSPVKLFEDVAMAMIESSGTLDVLIHTISDAKGGKQLSGLPSWVPDWTMSMSASLHHIYMKRSALIHLYNASGDTKCEWCRVEPGCVRTKILYLGKVTSTASGYPSQSSSKSGRPLLDEWKGLVYHPKCLMVVQETDWTEENELRHIISGSCCLMDRRMSDESHYKAFMKWRSWFTSNDPKHLSLEAKNDAREFDLQVQVASFERVMIRTDNGHIGFGPEATLKGDFVVLIAGGKVPFILRRTNEKGMLFKLVGYAYIHGAMLGELSGLSAEPWRYVTLV